MFAELTPEELDRTLSRQQFCDYIDHLIAHESIEMFDKFMDFLFSAMKVSKLIIIYNQA